MQRFQIQSGFKPRSPGYQEIYKLRKQTFNQRCGQGIIKGQENKGQCEIQLVIPIHCADASPLVNWKNKKTDVGFVCFCSTDRVSQVGEAWGYLRVYTCLGFIIIILLSVFSHFSFRPAKNMLFTMFWLLDFFETDPKKIDKPTPIPKPNHMWRKNVFDMIHSSSICVFLLYKTWNPLQYLLYLVVPSFLSFSKLFDANWGKLSGPRFDSKSLNLVQTDPPWGILSFIEFIVFHPIRQLNNQEAGPHQNI